MDNVKSIKILRACIEKIRNSSEAEKEKMMRVYEKYGQSDYKENHSGVELVLYGKLGKYLGSSSQGENINLTDEVALKSVYCSINTGGINKEINKIKEYKISNKENSRISSYDRNYGGNSWNLLAS